jgi:hypothetical protein
MQIMKSDNIGTIAEALVKAQQEMKPAVKDAENPFFKSKYADLSAVWEAVRGPLTSNGIAVVQSPVDCESGDVLIDTLLLHTSGEWIGGRLRMKPVATELKDKDGKVRGTSVTPQSIGSCITYARRYALGALTGLVTEEDDDGNAASEPFIKHVKNDGVFKAKEASRRDVPPAWAGVPPDTSLDASDPVIKFWKDKGKRVSELSDSSIEAYAQMFTKNLTDQTKARWHDEYEMYLIALSNEQAKRGMTEDIQYTEEA